MRQFTDSLNVLSAKAETGVGKVLLVSDYSHIVASIATASSASLTVKCAGSIADDAPNFGAAQSATNMWDYVDMIDLQSNSSIDGDTGLAPGGADDFRNFEVNVNALKWLTFVVTTYVAGSVTVNAKCFSDN